MLASQLIEQLQHLINEYGDMPVTVDKTKIQDIGLLFEMLDDPADEFMYIEGEVKAFEIAEGFADDRIEGF